MSAQTAWVAFLFMLYNQYPTIYVCTHNGFYIARALCVTIVLIAFFISISFFLTLIYLFHFWYRSLFYFYLFLFFFFNFWHRLFQANVKFSQFPVCVLSVVSWKMQTPREWNGIFFLFLFFLMKNKRCEVQFGKIDFKGLVCWKRRHFYYLSFIGTNRYIRFYSCLHKIL